jgi:hypothetical protein
MPTLANVLQESDYRAFEKWLRDQGWVEQPVRNFDWECSRWARPGRKKGTCIVYYKMRGLGIRQCDLELVQAFYGDRRRRKVLNEKKDQAPPAPTAR